jgi:hypothetical protein
MAERTYKIVKKDREGLDALRRPTAIEVAWAAGIYEGEGSCVTTRSTETSKSFAVSVSQKDPELLYRLRDLFGGTVSHYNRTFNKKVCPISHWKICGDRARTFIAVIYPFLTARRKGQIENTPACDFIEQAQDLLHFDVSLGQSKVYESLWERVSEYDATQHQKAVDHRKQREKEWRDAHVNDQARRDHRNALRRQRKQRKKIEKEQLQVVAKKLVAIA